MARVKLRSLRTGIAVRRADPDEGPLPPKVSDDLEDRLWEAIDNGELPVQQVAATLLLLLLGCRPESLSRLRMEDFTWASGGSAELRLPSVKKRQPQELAGFTSRKLRPPVAELVARLIAERPVAANGAQGRAQSAGGFLFWSLDEGGTLRGRPSVWFHYAVSRVVERLKISQDGVDGGHERLLRATPRRLRYTFATNAALGGMAPAELMYLLDHSSLQTVMVYYEPSLQLAANLERALETRLGEFARVALGQAKARRAGPQRLLATSAAPLACLQCSLFKPRSRLACLRAEEMLAAQKHEGRVSDRSEGHKASLDLMLKVARAAIEFLEDRA